MRLYHVSYTDLGREVKLCPREPINRAANEPERPARVCVAPRIGDALRLCPWTEGQHVAHVYVTEVKHVARASWALPKKYVPDYKKYGREEIWLLNKKGYLFTYVGEIRMNTVDMLIGVPFWHFLSGAINYDGVVDPTRMSPLSYTWR